MSIRATSNGLANINAYSMYNELFGKNTETAGTNAGSASSGNYAASSGSSAASGLLTPEGRAELGRALANMRKEGFTSFTWDDIEKYRKALEADFTKAVKADLAEMGVDPDIQFTLVMDAYGQVSVVSNHPDKAYIEEYLKDNPEMVDTFKHIQALSNLKRSQQRAAVQGNNFAKDMKASLQAEAVQAFFATTDNGGMDYFSQIANFGSNDATSWLLGLNQKV